MRKLYVFRSNTHIEINDNNYSYTGWQHNTMKSHMYKYASCYYVNNYCLGTLIDYIRQNYNKNSKLSKNVSSDNMLK